MEEKIIMYGLLYHITDCIAKKFFLPAERRIMPFPHNPPALSGKKAALTGGHNGTRRNGFRDAWSGAPVPQQGAHGKERESKKENQ